MKKGPGCWLWSGTAASGLYGHYLGKQAHRIAWELTYGPIPNGKKICHHCDNPPCVRPTHLFCGTQKQNSHDAVRKGRLPRGQQNGNSKLTEQQVLEIRQRYAAGEETQYEIADEFGITQANVWLTVQRKQWKHV